MAAIVWALLCCTSCVRASESQAVADAAAAAAPRVAMQAPKVTPPSTASPPQQGQMRASPCLSSPEYRQFDFWVGEWEVFDPGGQKVGENVVLSASKGCLVLENWTGTAGGEGKSMNFYEPSLKKWRQIWVGSLGAVSEFSGEYKDGAMRFSGETRMGADKKVQRRLTFFNLGPNEVRQFSERSTDEGASWQVDYDFRYKRRMPNTK